MDSFSVYLLSFYCGRVRDNFCADEHFPDLERCRLMKYSNIRMSPIHRDKRWWMWRWIICRLHINLKAHFADREWRDFQRVSDVVIWRERTKETRTNRASNPMLISILWFIDPAIHNTFMRPGDFWILRRVLTLLLHPTPTDNGLYFCQRRPQKMFFKLTQNLRLCFWYLCDD